MHHTIDYSGMPKPKQMYKALKDAKDYMGPAYYKRVMTALIDDAKQRGRKQMVRDARMLLPCLSGIQGPPARALILEALRQARYNRQA